MPSSEKLKWHLAAVENALSRGIEAWLKREEQLKSALRTERSIYAAELHDSLAQVLGYLRLKSARLDKLCQQAPYHELQPLSRDLAKYTHCAYRQTRELITASRLTLQTEKLSEGITNSVQEFEKQSAIVFELDNRLQADQLTPKIAMQILYIVRESLSNIVRHSHATHARVQVGQTATQHLHIMIEDNGIGIDPEAARNDSFGLQIMRERAERIGAELKIVSDGNNGTRIELVLNSG
jgi:nitrate/nitrite-specific signal transduction histidine kinase